MATVTRRSWTVLLVACTISVARPANAQPATTGPQRLTLDQAIVYAASHYPTIRAALEQITASAAGVSVARAAYLPRLDSVWQANRATANNVFGQLLPQSVLPAMSGPVLATATSQSVWGTAAGALFSWEPFDFGLRRATVASAEAGLTRARAGETLTRLEVQTAVANAFLGVAAAQHALVAASADLDRRDVLRRVVQSLVDNQLRPGAEASRADAERAAAQTRLAQAREAVALAEATLLRTLGLDAGSVVIEADALTARAPAADVPPATPALHPLARVHQAAVDERRATEELLARTDAPRVYVQSSVFARGSGAHPNSTFDGGFDGLAYDRANWAAGVQVVFPNLFDSSSLHARQIAAAAATRSELALHDEAVLSLASQQHAATALVQAARAVAASTPVQLAAAQQTEVQARARYTAGLAAIIEVADAQSLLAQAELQDQLARIDVWRALLASAVASGDLEPFLTLIRQP